MLAGALAALTGVLRRFDLVPPPMAIMIVSVLTLGFAIGLSPFGRAVATSAHWSACSPSGSLSSS